jgi:hypothetical protein
MIELKIGWIEKLMVPSESAQELSNEWTCQYVSTIWGAISVSDPW